MPDLEHSQLNFYFADGTVVFYFTVAAKIKVLRPLLYLLSSLAAMTA